MDMLTRHGMMFARASDSVYDDLQREILSKSQDGDKIKCNSSPGEQYNIIQIFTGTNKDFSGFFNEDHIGCFDKYENGFYSAGIAYIAKCHKECIKSLKARDLTSCKKNIRHKKHVDTQGAFERCMCHLEDYVGYTGNKDGGVGIEKCIA